MSSKPNRQKMNSPNVAPVVKSPEQTESLPSPYEMMAHLVDIQTLRDRPLITLVSCPDVTMRGDIIEQVYTQLRDMGKVPRLDLFLHSAGGQTEVPWRLITLIRDFCDHFAVLIPGIAHSAATHLAMGADEIVMGPLSELSPVDPARAHPLLPSKQDGEDSLTVSVQDLRHCMEFIKSEINDPTPEAMATVFSSLFNEIHPLAIGAIQQSYALARLVSEKALSTHMDTEKEADKIQRIVDAFSDEFYSHGYRIAWREAQELGLKVTHAEPDLWDAMEVLYRDYHAFFRRVRELKDNLLGRPLVWIDTAYQRCILEQILQKSKGGELKATLPPHWDTFPWTEKQEEE
jgi:hypothetical protein